MPWLRAVRETFRPKEYFERILEWHRTAYQRTRNETSRSMLHTVLARIFLLWEKEHPGPSLETGSKDLAWAYGVTQLFACLPPEEAVETMAMFMAIDRRSSLVKRVPELMTRYSILLGTLGGGVENNSLVEMYKRENLEPSNEEKVFYDQSVQKLSVRTVYAGEIEGRQGR